MWPHRFVWVYLVQQITDHFPWYFGCSTLLSVSVFCPWKLDILRTTGHAIRD